MKLKCIGHLGNIDGKGARDSRNICKAAFMNFEDMTTDI